MIKTAFEFIGKDSLIILRIESLELPMEVMVV